MIAATLQRRDAEMRNCRGFTLLEVLAALVIVALGMLGVIEAVSQTASNTGYIRDKTIAHWVAMNQLAQVRLSPTPPKIDKSSDEVEMADRRWRWTMNVTQTPLETVRRIDISVRLEDGDEASSLASITGFYGTAMAQPGSTIVLWQGSQDEQGEGGEDDDEGDDGKKGDPPPDSDPAPEPPEGEPVDTPIPGPDPEPGQ